MKSRFDDIQSAYKDLYSQLEYAVLVSDLQQAKPLFEQYLLLVENELSETDVTSLYKAYSHLLSLINNPENETTSLYGDVIIPLGKFQIRYEESCSKQNPNHSQKLFKPAMNKRALLDCALKADTDAAVRLSKRMLNELGDDWWKCLLQKTSGIEPCGVTWISISPLEYVTYIGDTAFRRMMLKCIPVEGYEKAIEQMLNVEKNGLEGRKRYAPFHKLIEASNFYLENFHTFPDYESIDKYLNKVIGGCQYQLSCFGLQWLCDNELPMLPFERAPSRELIVEHEIFSFVDSDLGDSFFIYKRGKDLNTYTSKNHHPLKYVDIRLADVPNSFLLTCKKLCQADEKALGWEIGLLENGITKNMKANFETMQIEESKLNRL